MILRYDALLDDITQSIESLCFAAPGGEYCWQAPGADFLERSTKPYLLAQHLKEFWQCVWNVEGVLLGREGCMIWIRGQREGQGGRKSTARLVLHTADSRLELRELVWQLEN
jgi:hypothetical protein